VSVREGTIVSWTRERARLAVLTRHRSPDDPAIAAARRSLATERLADHVERVIPTMTAEQCDRIAALLRPDTQGAGAP